ncbi:Pop3p NDAI_0A06000 [Naumovozyma dairenensis CBS 421]|uniref:Uncharacterized protein n=1 Tax=Naumovozyma dairenensis (strain ATCC 10597 / BCRC 20456 / CBS 421 / NBRC 0211 / NRRL Y-12639) TaxID=1071378 RepID=G0W4L7_NAUDC|nr:hypothetical protein NDAI_0A06000 [Naumovozyma dairenensis CBS 421]CCD22755.1 hypothetical protein NDAI_0A06000 [Naumovozyma dairenensis CBS 421]
MSNSLKALDKKIAKRRQVYKPLLDSPFIRESNYWPRIKDQKIVTHLLQNSILNKCKHFESSSIPRSEWPWDILFDFNEIISFLSSTDSHDKDDSAILFVCNKDQDIPAILLQQIPILCYLSQRKVSLIQLPRGSLQMFQEAITDRAIDNGLLLLRGNSKLDSSFVRQIEYSIEEDTNPLTIPWLESLKYKPSDIKLVKSSMPLQQNKVKKIKTPHRK